MKKHWFSMDKIIAQDQKSGIFELIPSCVWLTNVVYCKNKLNI